MEELVVGQELPLDGRRDDFEEWLRVPLPDLASESGFEVRKARESDFEAIYDLVNEGFGFKRSLEQYKWFYVDNPRGRAKCWLVIDRATGCLAASRARWPWPVALGDRPIPGYLGGDWVASRRFRGLGVSALIGQPSSMELRGEVATVLGWANAKGREATRKIGRAQGLVGSVPRGILPLRVEALLRQAGWWEKPARFLGFAADASFGCRWKRLGGGRSKAEIVSVRRFDASFDGLTQRCMAWHGFWCPHDAEFLNWRYFAHPTREHLAFAVMDGGRPAGYCVLRVGADTPHLMEFAVPQAPGDLARLLLAHAIRAAREAGCSRLDFFAPPSWRHWALFRTAGFLMRQADLVLYTDGPYEPEANRMENWQLVPGDHDAV